MIVETRTTDRTGRTDWLLRRHRIKLFAFQGDGRRFCRLFRETWGRLPVAARRRILSHWKRCDLGRVCLAESPVISLERPCWPRRPNQGVGRRFRECDFGMVNREGHQLVFNATTFDVMPEDVIKDVIAHELAHVVQWAEDPDPDSELHRERPEAELDADLQTQAWGFDPESVDRWAVAVGRSRVLPATAANIKKVLGRISREGR